MPVKLKISVTEEILNGAGTCRYDPGNCAIAKAVQTIFPNAYVFPQGGIAISEEYANRICRRDFSCGIPIPQEASDFICDFDEGKEVEPFSFDIELPDWVIDQMNIDEIRPLLVNHPTLELIEP